MICYKVAILDDICTDKKPLPQINRLNITIYPIILTKPTQSIHQRLHNTLSYKMVKI